MITQETKTFIQVETEYYFHENGLYIDPMLLVYPLVTEKYSYHHYKRVNFHISHIHQNTQCKITNLIWRIYIKQ